MAVVASAAIPIGIRDTIECWLFRSFFIAVSSLVDESREIRCQPQAQLVCPSGESLYASIIRGASTSPGDFTTLHRLYLAAVAEQGTASRVRHGQENSVCWPLFVAGTASLPGIECNHQSLCIDTSLERICSVACEVVASMVAHYDI